VTVAAAVPAVAALAGLFWPFKAPEQYVRMAPPAPAPPVVRPWRPTGAAINVTGSVMLGPEAMTAAGARFPLRAVSASSQAMIFQVTGAVNPPLINRARLCPAAPPTWIVAAPIPPSGLELAVFAGTTAPKGPNSPGVCATYFYDR
jgi:hypothetical protein